MRVAVLGTSQSGSDPSTIRLVNTLASAGHEVTFISVGSVDAQIAQVSERVVTVDTRWPPRGVRIGAQIRRFNPKWARTWLAHRGIEGALAQASPDVVHPTTTAMARVADDAGYPVSLDPRFHLRPRNDFAEIALRDPSLSGTSWVALSNEKSDVPQAGRFEGKRVTMCYNPTATSPGRYLRTAFERAGVHVDHRYPFVDLSTIPTSTDAVLFIESPNPSLEVKGSTTRPVLYWVHHGEHHLYQNIRLARRYKADALLLAHSWHLGYRFDVPVTRFPFGVPMEMIQESVAWVERSIDVAMIGAGFDDDSERYLRRRRVAQDRKSVV